MEVSFIMLIVLCALRGPLPNVCALGEFESRLLHVLVERQLAFLKHDGI